MLPLVRRVCVKKIGRIGVSISVAKSANKLAAARRTVFFDNPENKVSAFSVGTSRAPVG